MSGPHTKTNILSRLQTHYFSSCNCSVFCKGWHCSFHVIHCAHCPRNVCNTTVFCSSCQAKSWFQVKTPLPEKNVSAGDFPRVKFHWPLTTTTLLHWVLPLNTCWLQVSFHSTGWTRSQLNLEMAACLRPWMIRGQKLLRQLNLTC